MGNKSEIIRTMKEKAEAVQTVFGVVSGLEAAFSYAIDLTGRQGKTTIAAPGLPEQEHSRFALPASLPGKGGLPRQGQSGQ